MNILAILASEDPSQTHHWLFPENYEMIWGIPASIMIFGLLIWKAGPLLVKAFRARTERIQTEIDEANADKAAAEGEAAQVRQALGDIEAERGRLLAEADEQAAALKSDGAVRLDAEVADLEAKADADIAALASRGSDELRSEIARLSAAAAEHVVNGQLTDEVHHELIEGFIQKVGVAR